MDINAVFPSKYLKAADLDGDKVFTISHVEVEDMSNDGDSEMKPVIYFKEVKKGFVCNKTNAGTISHLHGPDTDAWAGKQITLFGTEVDFGGKQVLSIRVRMRKPVTSPTGAAPSGQSAPVSPLADTVQEVKMMAWAEFQRRNAGSPDITNKFKLAVSAYYPNVDPKTLGVAAWRALLANDFKKPVIENPIGDNVEFTGDDIPF